MHSVNSSGGKPTPIFSDTYHRIVTGKAIRALLFFLFEISHEDNDITAGGMTARNYTTSFSLRTDYSGYGKNNL